MLVTLLAIAGAHGSAMQSVAAGEMTDSGDCPLSPGEYEARGYFVRHVRVRGLFDLFQRVPSTAVHLPGVELPTEGGPFRVDQTVAAATALERRLHQSFPGMDAPVAVTLVVSNLERCTDDHGEKQLDVRYRTLAARPPLLTGVTIESREAQRSDPAAAAGSLPPARVTLAPAAAYNPSDGFQAGGIVSLRHLANAIDTVDALAVGSTRSHLVRVAMAGSQAPRLTWIDRDDWRASFTDQEQAGAPGAHFATNAFRGQFTGQTLPFGPPGAVFRFGGGLEGGHQDAVVDSSAGSIGDRTGYGAVRAAGGIAISGRRYSAAASYGVLLGHLPGNALVNYRKHIADVAWNAELPLAEHTALHIDARLNAGWLTGGDAAPLAERFRGGNREESFFEGGSWTIHSNPFLRSVPSNRLDRTSADTSLGGDRFIAMNVTLAVPVWRYPLIPVWLARSSGFKNGIKAARETARNQAVVYYQSKDPAQKLMAGDAQRATTVLETLWASLSAAHGSVDPQHSDAFDDCLDAADTARDKMTRLKDTGFGPVATNVVPGVARACGAELVAVLPRETAAALDELKALASAIGEHQKLVRTDLAQAKADADLKFAFTAIDTFIDDVNALAIGPVISLDAARLRSYGALDAGRARYGVGLGARVSVVNVLHLTALYAWNPSPLPWESRGAWLMSLTVSDLLR